MNLSELKEISEEYAHIICFSKNLLRNSKYASDARNYLNTRISIDSQKKFDFGFFPTNDNNNILLNYLDRNILKKLHLMYNFNIEDKNQPIKVWVNHFNNHNIIFPYKDEYGNIIALAGRSIYSNEKMKELKIPKYMYAKGFSKSSYLYGLYQAKPSILKKGYAIVVEGQLDCITCHAHGFKNVVALGGSSFSVYQLYSLLKNTDKIYLLLDNDSPGQKAASAIMSRYGGYAKFEKILLPDGVKDVDEYLNNCGNYDIFSNLNSN